MAVSILIADDHQLVLDGLTAIVQDRPEFNLVGTARNGREAVKLVALLKPDIVFMDIDMPGMNGLEATSIIKRDHPETSVVILTMHSEPSLVKAVINFGANGYLLKNADRHEFIDALLKVAEGKSYFSPELTRSLVSEGAKSSSFLTSNPSLLLSKLTEREIEVLRLIAEGLSNKEIGDQLFISHRTVDTHRTNLMKKLDIHNIAGLIKFAFGNGLVDS